MTASSAKPDKPLRTPPPRRGQLAILAAALTVLAVYGSFVPLEFKAIAWRQAVEQFRHVRYLNLGLYKRADFVANLLLFVPLGFFWLGAIDLDRRSRLAGVVMALPLAAMLVALAVAVEFTQQWFPRRTVSVNDMLAESVGGAAGIAAWFVLGRALVGRVRQLYAPAAHDSALRRLLQLYALGLVLYALQPMDLAFGPEAIARKFADGRILLRPLAHHYANAASMLWDLGVDVLLFVPIGMLTRLRRDATLRPIALAGLLAVLAAALIEVAQLFVFSRYADATDVFTGGLGGFVGAMLAGPVAARAGVASGRGAASGGALTTRKRLAVALLLCAVYVVPLAAAFWHPYQLIRDPQVVAERLRLMFAAPFKGYYWGSEFGALTNLARGFMLFLPIGSLLRWGAGRTRTWSALLICLAAALVIGMLIEAGQAMLVNKYADVTDLGVYLCGTLTGWSIGAALCRREPGSA